MPKAYFLLFILAAAILPLTGCGGPSGSPVDDLKAYFKDIPTWSVILEDMKIEGTFFDSYYHKYKITVPPGEGTTEAASTETAPADIKTYATEWYEISQKRYKNFENMLGMTVYSKTEGQESTTPGPPGYEYVGDKRYGQWQSNSSGQSFWVFYGQYRLLSDLLGGGRVYRGGYDTYRRDRSQGRAYYGPRGDYGTNGRITKRQRPNFHDRRMAKQKTFSQKVDDRAGRTKTGYRGRSGRVGK